jgi:hypothetical protein
LFLQLPKLLSETIQFSVFRKAKHTHKNKNDTTLGGGEVQSPLNKKLSSKFLRAVNFALKFVFSIKSKF